MSEALAAKIAQWALTGELFVAVTRTNETLNTEKAPASRGFFDGASRDRTGDLLIANQALSHLSYSPETASLALRDWALATRLGVQTGFTAGSCWPLCVERCCDSQAASSGPKCVGSVPDAGSAS